jgi:hypothetical protein
MRMLPPGLVDERRGLQFVEPGRVSCSRESGFAADEEREMKLACVDPVLRVP